MELGEIQFRGNVIDFACRMAKVGLLKQCFLEFFPFFRAVLMLEFGSESVVETTKFEFPTGGRNGKRKLCIGLKVALKRVCQCSKGYTLHSGWPSRRLLSKVPPERRMEMISVFI